MKGIVHQIKSAKCSSDLNLEDIEMILEVCKPMAPLSEPPIIWLTGTREQNKETIKSLMEILNSKP